MVSDLVLTEQHTFGRAVAPNSVGLGSYGTDTHEVRRIVKLPKTQAYIAQMALMTRDLDQAAVTDFVREEFAYWGPLAKEVGLRVQ